MSEVGQGRRPLLPAPSWGRPALKTRTQTPRRSRGAAGRISLPAPASRAAGERSACALGSPGCQQEDSSESPTAWCGGVWCSLARSLEALASPHTPRPSHEVPPPPASVAEQQDHWQGLSRLNFVLLDKGSSLMQSVFINNESSVSPCAPSLSLGDVGTHQTVSLVQATEGAGLMSLNLRAMAYLKQLIKMRFIHREPSPCGSKAS